MNRDEIRKQTGLIIEKDGEFLIGYNGLFLRWGISPSDAWKTRDIDAAKMVSEKFGGQIMLFNPVVRQLRKYREENHEKVSEECGKGKTQDNGCSQQGNEKTMERCLVGELAVKGHENQMKMGRNFRREQQARKALKARKLKKIS